MPLTTRRARPDDLPTLRTFEQGVIAAERPFDPTLRPDPVRYYDLEAMLRDPRVDLVVAEDEGRLVAAGYARVEAAKPFADHAEYAYLGFMFVAPDHRGQGINARVLGALAALVRARGIHELRLEVYAENAPAIRAYEKYGFAPLLLQMRMEIPDGPAL